MSIKLGDEAPNFTAQSTKGEINFHEYIDGSWAVLFSHPKDFTPVCTTELGTVAQLSDEFEKRNVKVLGLSVDGIESHNDWVGDIEDVCQTEMNYPLLADENKEIANAYDMIHPNELATLTVRSVFILNPDKKVMLTLTYPASVGRNFDEILRVIDSLQIGAKYKVATPANWKSGDDVVVGSGLSDEEANELFPEGFNAVKPYLRYVADPASKVTSN